MSMGESECGIEFVGERERKIKAESKREECVFMCVCVCAVKSPVKHSSLLVIQFTDRALANYILDNVLCIMATSTKGYHHTLA